MRKFNHVWRYWSNQIVYKYGFVIKNMKEKPNWENFSDKGVKVYPPCSINHRNNSSYYNVIFSHSSCSWKINNSLSIYCACSRSICNL